MKFAVLLSLSVLTISMPALAQSIESMPLNQPTYTQDVPMPPEGGSGGGSTFKKMEPIANPAGVDAQAARDAAAAAPDNALPATPPPGPDSIPAQADSAPVEPAVTSAPVSGGYGDATSVSPAGDRRPPAPVGQPPQRGPSFRNGATPPDENMSSRVFCTMKVSFAADADAKTYDAVKAYVDANSSIIRLQPVKPTKGAAQDLCMMIDQHNARAKTYKDLKKLLPMKTRKPSGVTLSGEGFTPVTTRD